MQLKSRIRSIFAAFGLLAIIISGTFAWTNFSSTIINAWRGVGAPLQDTGPGGTLHDNHEDSNSDKRVFVENWGDEDLFVRIRLDEHMEMGDGAGLKSASTDESGNPIHNPQNNATPLNPSANINDVTTWDTHIPTVSSEYEEKPEVCQSEADFHKYWQWGMGGQVYFLPALIENRTNKSYVSTVGSTVVTADCVNADGIRARRTLMADVVTMAQWISDGKMIGNYWVIDTDGWAYWASPLHPGNATGLLLNSVDLISVPEEDYFYGINVIAQMATKDGQDVGGALNNYTRFGDQENGGWTSEGQALMELIVNSSNGNGTNIRTGVKFELVPMPDDTFKLVFQGLTPSTIMILDTTFSFDNTIVRPVRASNQTEIEPIQNMGTTDLPFVILAEDQIGNSFINLPVRWRVNGNRTAFNFGIFAFPGQVPYYATSDSNYVDLFEFYFKIQPDKSIDDITGTTFRFEHGLDEDNFVVMFSPIPANGIGLHLMEGVQNDFFWGAANQERFPDSIDEVLNPFSLGNRRSLQSIGNFDIAGVSNDGQFDTRDLALIISNFGKFGENITDPSADLNGDGRVDFHDLSILIDALSDRP